jgi:hypothetical protein
MTEQNFLSSSFEDLLRTAVRPNDPSPEALEKIWLDVNRQTGADCQIHLSAHPSRRMLWAGAGALVLLLAIIVALLSPQRVLAEIRRFIEIFVPGYGLVQDEDSLRMIAAPVRQERSGSWDTIEQAFTDPTRTLVIPGERYHEGPLNMAGCTDTSHHPPYLTFPGKDRQPVRLDLVEERGGMVFPPIPPEVADVTLVMEWTWPCTEEPDWQFPLHFDAAPPGTTIPVIAVQEIAPTPMTTPAPSGSGQVSATVPAPTANLALQAVVETANGYIFGGSLTWPENPDAPVRYDLPMPDTLQLVDGAWKPLLLENTNPNDLQLGQTERKPNELRWAYQVSGKDFTSPLTLTIPGLIKFVDDPSGRLTFQLDFGADPQSGLGWGADREYELDGVSFKLLKVVYNRDTQYPDNYEVLYSFQADPRLRSVYLFSACPDQPVDPAVMGGGGGSSGTIEIVDGVLKGYASLPAAPKGLCTFTITGIEYQEAAPRQVIVPLPGK